MSEAKSHQPLTNGQLLLLAWRIAAGWRGIFGSGHFWVALVVWAVCTPAWTAPEWWKDPIAVIPSLLGFTLGGFAIFLGFGSDPFKEMISSEDEEKAAYLSVSAAFLMFVGFQTLGLLWAIACAATWQPTPNFLLPVAHILHQGQVAAWGFGYFLFVYGIVLAFHAALRIFRLSRWYNSFLVANAAASGETTDAANDSVSPDERK